MSSELVRCQVCGRDVPEAKTELRQVKTSEIGGLLSKIGFYTQNVVCFRCCDRLDELRAKSGMPVGMVALWVVVGFFVLFAIGCFILCAGSFMQPRTTIPRQGLRIGACNAGSTLPSIPIVNALAGIVLSVAKPLSHGILPVGISATGPPAATRA